GADTVVLAVGTRSYDPLGTLVTGMGIPCAVVGDARKAAMVFDAIHQGFRAGSSLTTNEVCQ
ncbi:MAG TPA: hypothetical protein VIU40_10920, partial [Geobacteraceae bacterium]